jgi:putative transposase
VNRSAVPDVLPFLGWGAMGKRSLPVMRGRETRSVIVVIDNDVRAPTNSQPTRKTRRSYNVIGHARELTFSCYRRMPLLASDRTRQWLVDALATARAKRMFELWAYVAMPEHAHILLRPLSHKAEIAPILKAIKQPVARKATNHLRANNPQWLKRLEVRRPNGRVEYRFWQQGGGYDRNILTSKAARAAIEYIHNNPVRRGLVDNPTDWPWSSARWYAGCDDAKIEMDPLRLGEAC